MFWLCIITGLLLAGWTGLCIFVMHLDAKYYDDGPM